MEIKTNSIGYTLKGILRADLAETLKKVCPTLGLLETIDNYTTFVLYLTKGSCISLSKTRLCRQDNNIKELWHSILLEIKDYDEKLYNECVPACIDCMYCKKETTCGYVDKFFKWCYDNNYRITDKESRYAAFRVWRRAENAD